MTRPGRKQYVNEFMCSSEGASTRERSREGGIVACGHNRMANFRGPCAVHAKRGGAIGACEGSREKQGGNKIFSERERERERERGERERARAKEGRAPLLSVRELDLVAWCEAGRHLKREQSTVGRARLQAVAAWRRKKKENRRRRTASRCGGRPKRQLADSRFFSSRPVRENPQTRNIQATLGCHAAHASGDAHEEPAVATAGGFDKNGALRVARRDARHERARRKEAEEQQRHDHRPRSVIPLRFDDHDAPTRRRRSERHDLAHHDRATRVLCHARAKFEHFSLLHFSRVADRARYCPSFLASSSLLRRHKSHSTLSFFVPRYFVASASAQVALHSLIFVFSLSLTPQ